MKKVVLAIVLTLLMAGTVMSVLAAEGNTVQPLYHSISTIDVGLGIDQSTGIATVGGAVDAYYQVPVEVLTQLQVYKDGQWKTLMSWSNPGIGAAFAGGQYTVTPGYNYRTRVTGYICNDLGIPIESETETKEVYYPAA